MIKYEKFYFYLIHNLNKLFMLWSQKQRIFDFFWTLIFGLFKKS